MPRALETPLTEKQRKFVVAFLGEADRNAHKAARLAGYACAEAVANRLIKNASIIKAVREADTKGDNALILSVEQRKQALSDIIKGGEEHNKIKAIDVLNKMEPVYINRHELHFDGMDNAKLNEESADIMRQDGWICISPDDPAHARVKEMLE